MENFNDSLNHTTELKTPKIYSGLFESWNLEGLQEDQIQVKYLQ